MKDHTKGRTPKMPEPFFPNKMLRYIIVFCFLLVVECIAVVIFPLLFSLVDKPDHVPGFALPVYEFSKIIQNDKLLILILGLCTLFFVLLPFIESAFRSAPKNKVFLRRPAINE